ncbi:MAG: hypothetical protein EA428_00215 [Spirochaetaceae bacterium]|nr:MAG: hypothetical protein EA428_00215 [Spirochaetaceae bacterium]
MSEGPRILLSFVGNRDPYVTDGFAGALSAPETRSEVPGPVLSLLETRDFDRVVLFCTGSEYLERARSVATIVENSGGGPRFQYVSLELESPIDYEEIYLSLQQTLTQVLAGHAHESARYSVLLDPGTPQMQTSWFLLVRSGALPAQLLQGVPPRFAGGSYKVKEVQLESSRLPTIQAIAPDVGPISAPSELVLRESTPASERAWITAQLPPVIGRSKAFLDVLDSSVRIAAYDISVLIRGETGSGKGVLARFIHENSDRARGPFVALNCSAVAPSLAESELFGHAKGAFTGATGERLGQFRAADGGTLFLDEIGDLPLDLQPKLLRVLEAKVVVPVGSDKTVATDVRVLAATNRDLEQMIAEGSFRRDLYERLNQMSLILPPLRDRPEDIVLLVQQFIENWNRKYHEQKGLSPETVDHLLAYGWPGNVRELENAVIALCASGRSAEIGPEFLPPAVKAAAAREHGAGGVNGSGADGVAAGGTSAAGIKVDLPEDGIELRAVLGEIERAYYLEALERSGGNKERAASLLGISGHAFRKALKERFNLS